MEFSPRVVAVERALVAVCVAAALALAFLQWRSPLAAAIRAQKPAFFKLSLDPGPRDFIVEYLPAPRALWLAYAPDPRSGEDYPRARFSVGRWPPDEPPLAAKRLLKPLRPILFLRLAAAAGDIPPFDRFLLAVELARMSPAEVRAAYLPDDAEPDEFWARLSSAPAPSGRPVTVEILNATDKKGVAARATKFLRSRDADVMVEGNAPQERRRTVVYDRMGRPEAAEWVRARLGCPSAETATQLDARSIVDVTVVLGDDCAQPGD